MSDEAPNIVFEFIGGSEDGARYEGPIARGYYWAADHGRVGSQFNVPTEYSFMPTEHGAKETTSWFAYEVEERRDEWDHIYLRARFVGKQYSTSLDATDS